MRALLALGSNLGDRRRFLDDAIAQLRDAGVRILERGAPLETAAYGGDPSLDYLNLALEVDTDRGPWQLLALCKRIERAAGRDLDGPRNAPRVIDIDIIACRGTTVVSAALTIPHPRLWRREFVFEPLRMLQCTWWHESLRAAMMPE